MMLTRTIAHLALAVAAVGTPALARDSAQTRPIGGIVIAQADGAAPSSVVEGVGVVVAADPDTTKFGAATLTVDHEEIPGFMGPMEMMYSVTSPDLLDGLEPGDHVRFTIDTVSVTINAVEEIAE
jgi:Cu/Ag efflux protein CusF